MRFWIILFQCFLLSGIASSVCYGAKARDPKACARLLTQGNFWEMARHVDMGDISLVREIISSHILDSVEIRARKLEVGSGVLVLRTPKSDKEFYLFSLETTEALIRTVQGRFYRIRIEPELEFHKSLETYRSMGLLPESTDKIGTSFAEVPDYGFIETILNLARKAGFKNVTEQFSRLKSVSFGYVEFHPGEFEMGSPSGEKDRHSDEVLHPVVITKPFQIAKTPVTQAQWLLVMKNAPSGSKVDIEEYRIEKTTNGYGTYGENFNIDPNKPVENVSWKDVQEFLLRLNESQNEYIYRLPTEAEWEYAARAGTKNAYFFGNDPKDLIYFAHFADSRPTDVANRNPNPAGLFDMLGNVYEWVSDWYAPYDLNVLKDPQGPLDGNVRCRRGGAWDTEPRLLRIARRSHWLPNEKSPKTGFRLVRVRRTQGTFGTGPK